MDLSIKNIIKNSHIFCLLYLYLTNIFILIQVKVLNRIYSSKKYYWIESKLDSSPSNSYVYHISLVILNPYHTRIISYLSFIWCVCNIVSVYTTYSSCSLSHYTIKTHISSSTCSILCIR